MPLKPKRKGVGLEMRTFKAKGKNDRFLVFRTPYGSYHVFKEVEAKQAARDCGANIEANTREMWREVWDRRKRRSR